MSEQCVYVLYGFDRYYPPSYGVIAVFDDREKAMEVQKLLRQQGHKKIQEGDTRYPKNLRGGYAGMYETIQIKQEVLI